MVIYLICDFFLDREENSRSTLCKFTVKNCSLWLWFMQAILHLACFMCCNARGILLNHSFSICATHIYIFLKCRLDKCKRQCCNTDRSIGTSWMLRNFITFHWLIHAVSLVSSSETRFRRQMSTFLCRPKHRKKSWFIVTTAAIRMGNHNWDFDVVSMERKLGVLSHNPRFLVPIGIQYDNHGNNVCSLHILID